MFASRFFTPRAFASRYFPKVGADPTTSVGTLVMTVAAPTMTVSRAAATMTIEVA